MDYKMSDLQPRKSQSLNESHDHLTAGKNLSWLHCLERAVTLIRRHLSLMMGHDAPNTIALADTYFEHRSP